MMQKKRILIDCDPGIDDVLAMMFALVSPELEIAGITTVCGNVPAALGAENALRILKRAGRLHIPVYVGEEKPLRREYVSAQDTHGMDGLGETFMEPVQEIRPRKGAVDFLLETLRAEAGQPEGAERAPLSVLALGPMTNLARALEKDPEAFAFADQVVSMGGSFRSHGNCSPTAEYNYWCDPDAAAFCYQRLGELGKPIHMVGLDVTRKIVLTPNVLEYMKQLDGELGGFIQQITRFYFDFHWKQEGVIGCVINDPLAAAYLADETLCGGFDAYTAIETEGICLGQSVVDSMDFWKKKPNSRVLTQVDPLRFMTMFVTRLFPAAGTEEQARRVLEQILVPEGGRA